MQLTVKNNYPPEPPTADHKGRKNHKIIGTDGASYLAKPLLGPQLIEGQTYEVVTATDGYNNSWINSVTILPDGAPTPSAPPWEPPPFDYAASPADYAAATERLKPPFPAAIPTAAAPHDKEEGMFIMSCVGRAMGSGSFTAMDISVLTKAAVAAWKDRHNG